MNVCCVAAAHSSKMQPLPSDRFCLSLNCLGTSQYRKSLFHSPGSCTQPAELGLQTLTHLTASVVSPHITFLFGDNKLDDHYKQEDYEHN